MPLNTTSLLMPGRLSALATIGRSVVARSETAANCVGLDAAFLTRTKPGTLLTTLPVTAAYLAEFFRGMGMVVAKVRLKCILTSCPPAACRRACGRVLDVFYSHGMVNPGHGQQPFGGEVCGLQRQQPARAARGGRGLCHGLWHKFGIQRHRRRRPAAFFLKLPIARRADGLKPIALHTSCGTLARPENMNKSGDDGELGARRV